MSNREPRYWERRQDAGPGEVVAEHNGGIAMERYGTFDPDTRQMAAGPGNYTVTVRQPGKPIPGDDAMPSHRPIELHSYVRLAPGQPFRFNPGMARWFGMRLIEAAAICEGLSAGEGDATPTDDISLKSLAIARLRDAARKVIDEQSAPAAMELRAVLREAIAAKMVTLEDYQADVLGYFTPNEQTILRGRTDF